MPFATSPGEFYDILAVGPAAQLIIPAAQLGLATPIAESGSSVSDVIPTNGFKIVAFGLTSSQAGSVSIQPYLDEAGTIAAAAPTTGTLVAGTPLVVAVTGVTMSSLKITVTNSSGTTAANLTNVIVLLQAA
jgi:hypothetical protein